MACNKLTVPTCFTEDWQFSTPELVAREQTSHVHVLLTLLLNTILIRSTPILTNLGYDQALSLYLRSAPGLIPLLILCLTFHRSYLCAIAVALLFISWVYYFFLAIILFPVSGIAYIIAPFTCHQGLIEIE